MRILIADDHDLLRDMLVHYLGQQPGIDVVTAADIDEVLDAIERKGPFDLVVLDYVMQGMNGLHGLERTLAAVPGQRVALMSGIASRDVAERALALGAAGFLPKTLSANSLVNAIRFMAVGEQYAPAEFLSGATASPHPMAELLTRRELQVLQRLCLGESNKEIARELALREPTVKLHVKTLYRKIGAANRTQAVVIAKEAGLF